MLHAARARARRIVYGFPKPPIAPTCRCVGSNRPCHVLPCAHRRKLDGQQTPLGQGMGQDRRHFVGRTGGGVGFRALEGAPTWHPGTHTPAPPQGTDLANATEAKIADTRAALAQLQKSLPATQYSNSSKVI